MAEPPQSPPGSATTGTGTGTDADAFLFGVRTASRSVFAFVIVFTYIGFGALCQDYGLSVGWAMLSTALQWAGPAQVILVTGLGPGTVLIETAVAVALSSVRFLPIVVSILPLVRRDNTSPWQLLVPVHFMAISVWVEAMRHAPGLPRERRIPFCNGIGATLLGLGVVFTAVGYYMQSLLPAMFGAAAMFITPISFLTSAARNARQLLDKAALGLGIVIGPVLAVNQVPFDLLWTGIIAGTLAYGVHRVQRTRNAGKAA
ncbi:MAG: AzlC family ABC transporter permease [Xanthobacteraceae bacterium]|nr:AzlC family ABC transporter permease [Xanthobacteraceae bacterium]